MKPRPVRFIDSFVRSFVRSFLPAFLDAPVFSSSRASNRIGDDYRVTMLFETPRTKRGEGLNIFKNLVSRAS